MKRSYWLLFFIVFSLSVKGMGMDPCVLNDSLSKDTLAKNIYGNLLNDLPEYNKKSSIWLPISEAIAADVLIWMGNRLVLQNDFSKVSPDIWIKNRKYGPEWDDDTFGINFILHPYSGTITYNAGRSNGYNYLESFVFAVGGSLLWECFAENTRASYNDVINTPINGAFLGEILYRLSSNILDDRTRGRERVFREICAGIINPMRGFNRIIQGKIYRNTPIEVYQKEPVNISIYRGFQKINNKAQFGTGAANEMLTMQVDYGNAFELRSRKPFDFFRLRVEMNYGMGGRVIGNVIGYGILSGRSSLNEEDREKGKLTGVFQYYDYWNTNTFELAALSFGVGVIKKRPIYKSSNLYSSAHIGLVPLAGNSTKYGPGSTEFREYNYGAGVDAKLENTIDLNWISLKLSTYLYYVQTYVGTPGANLIAIARPRIAVKIYKNLSIGFEQYAYYSYRLSKSADFFVARTNQQLFLLLYLQDPKRKGRYY